VSSVVGGLNELLVEELGYVERVNVNLLDAFCKNFTLKSTSKGSKTWMLDVGYLDSST
jgi:hypothetical protein